MKRDSCEMYDLDELIVPDCILAIEKIVGMPSLRKIQEDMLKC